MERNTLRNSLNRITDLKAMQKVSRYLLFFNDRQLSYRFYKNLLQSIDYINYLINTSSELINNYSFRELRFIVKHLPNIGLSMTLRKLVYRGLGSTRGNLLFREIHEQ